MRGIKMFEVLAFLLTTRSSSRIINAAITGNFSKRQVSNTLQHLRRKGLVSYDGSVWSITEEGKKFYREKGGRMVFRFFQSDERKGNKGKKDDKQILILFDIPEKERRKRDWLRAQLKLFGFRQVQKSAWLGPDVLSKEFFDYLEELKIRTYLKVFHVSKK